MSKISENIQNEIKEEELDIVQENKKLYEKLMKDLGFTQENDEKRKQKPQDRDKAFQIFSKFESYNADVKDLNAQKKSEKSILNRINELQQEINLVSKEINDYVELNSDNTLLKKELNFNSILEELKLYSTKLENIINSDFYKNTLNSTSPQISKDKSILKTQIQTNLKNYTNSTSRLIELISQEKENFYNKKDNDTTTHEIYINKYKYENNNKIINSNFEKELLEIENELNKIESIVGVKKLDMDENYSISQIMNKLIKTVNDKKYQLFKEKTLNELNQILDEVLKEKEISIDISEYFVKLRELYSIYEVYENYDEIMKYIKKRLIAIIDINEKSTNFNSDLDFLKKIIEENEKQFAVLGKRYMDTFEELAGLENILKDLKNLDKYFEQLLVE